MPPRKQSRKPPSFRIESLLILNSPLGFSIAGSEMAASQQRLPFTGSCHCSSTRYIVYLAVPHKPSLRSGSQKVYRCNCTVCHKSGIFHVRVPSPADDFLLLAPLDPFKELGDYLCADKVLHFFFCKTCGGRCFTFEGDWEVVNIDLDELGLNEEQKSRLSDLQGKTKAWKPTQKNTEEKQNAKEGYLSVNGHSIDQKQPGFDMGDLLKNKTMGFVDMLRFGEEDAGRPTLEGPYPYGSY